MTFPPKLDFLATLTSLHLLVLVLVLSMVTSAIFSWPRQWVSLVKFSNPFSKWVFLGNNWLLVNYINTLNWFSGLCLINLQCKSGVETVKAAWTLFTGKTILLNFAVGKCFESHEKQLKFALYYNIYRIIYIIYNQNQVHYLACWLSLLASK